MTARRPGPAIKKESLETLSLGDARRIALAGQGFDRPRPRAPIRAEQIARTIRQLGLLQIDCVNVLVRAQYQVLYSRLGPYDMSLADDVMYRDREFTEQWAHEASILPVETWPLLRHRMEMHRVRPWGFEKFMDEHSDYVERVIEDVRARGPLAADALPELDGIPRRIPGVWVGTVPRAVLEAHFGCGRLAVTERRPDFSRVYDLAERIIPSEHHGRIIEREKSRQELLRKAAIALGVATANDLADYYRMPIRDARPHLATLVEAGELRQVCVEGWREPAYLHKAARIPARIGAAALVSPFDPLIWYRERVARLFEFEYRVEIYVPPQKRKWGYYVLPFLLGDRLAARVDLKADRTGRQLLVLAAYIELNAKAGTVADALARELQSMARWLGLESVTVRSRRGFARTLAAALHA